MMKYFALSLFLLANTVAAFGQTESQRAQHFNIRKNLALEGYDPVSYFEGKPLEGDEDFKTIYKGISYHFASAANLQKFKSTPEKYEPVYGGWCAYAMGETGEKVKVDPETFKIIGGKLYLFYNFWGNNTLEDWNKEETRLKKAGDINWLKLLK